MITLEVDAIHRSRGIAILSDGQEVPIVQWIAAGNDAADPHEATACVCGPDFGRQMREHDERVAALADFRAAKGE